MSRRRVLIIVENLPVPFDRRVWLEATTLADAGYDVSVICPTGRGYERRREIIDGVTIYRHPLPLEAAGGLGYLLEYGAALFWELTLSIRVAFTRGFDVIHACNPPDLIFLVAALFKPFGKRFVFDQHDLCPEVYESKFGRQDFLWRVLKAAERTTFALADVVISTNQSYRQVAIDRGRKEPKDIFIVRSGPDLSKWPNEPTGDPKWRNGRTHLVGYLGVMGEQEGIDLFLESARLLVHERGRRDIQFLLVGDGSSRQALERLALELGLGDFVTFTGRVPDEELFSALGEADLCVNPDRPGVLNDKSTMNKIIEYMALGKPIVQFDLAEGRFSAQDSSLYARPGDTLDFADKIEALLEDPDLRRRMGKAGRRRVEAELAWKHQVPKLLAAYEAVFRRPPTGSRVDR